MSELVGIARFKIHEGKLEEFKRLSAQAMEIVNTKGASMGGVLPQQRPAASQRAP